jgi:hypothetical protein
MLHDPGWCKAASARFSAYLTGYKLKDVQIKNLVIFYIHMRLVRMLNSVLISPLNAMPFSVVSQTP